LDEISAGALPVLAEELNEQGEPQDEKPQEETIEEPSTPEQQEQQAQDRI
jgi:hypothetical protein